MPAIVLPDFWAQLVQGGAWNVNTAAPTGLAWSGLTFLDTPPYTWPGAPSPTITVSQSGDYKVSYHVNMTRAGGPSVTLQFSIYVAGVQQTPTISEIVIGSGDQAFVDFTEYLVPLVALQAVELRHVRIGGGAAPVINTSNGTLPTNSQPSSFERALALPMLPIPG